MSALDRQEGGSHYSDMAIQPVEFIVKNEIGYLEGNVIKYVCRYKNKNGIEDLKKAQHYLEMMVEHEQSIIDEAAAREKARESEEWYQEFANSNRVAAEESAVIASASPETVASFASMASK